MLHQLLNLLQYLAPYAGCAWVNTSVIAVKMRGVYDDLSKQSSNTNQISLL
ncbi:hypothetical protein OK016_09140 [Vibrio chagasii]|nr:hypothetical protein [Vibrio chagasii]